MRPLAYTAFFGRLGAIVTLRHEIAVAICGPKLLPAMRPLGGNAATAHDLSVLTSKISAKSERNGNLQLELHPLHAAIHNVNVFVHAAAD